MNIWTLRDADPTMDAAQAALIGMISHLGSPRFMIHGLGEVNRALEAGSWSVYRVFGQRPPVCYLSGSFRRRDTTGECFRVYRDHLYQRDRTFEAIDRDLSGNGLNAIHLTAREVANPDHRRAIYERHRLRERLSVAKVCGDGSILSVNLYRHEDQSGYHDRDLQTFHAFAPSLYALIERQIALTNPSQGPWIHASGNAACHRQALLQLAPGITSRELDVCTRLLAGMTHDGVACDLGISATTVKTYRNRAFARLGIHHNNALFALVLERAASVAPS